MIRPVFGHIKNITLWEAMSCSEYRKWLSIDWRCTSCALILLSSSQDVYLLFLLLHISLSHPTFCPLLDHVTFYRGAQLQLVTLLDCIWFGFSNVCWPEAFVSVFIQIYSQFREKYILIVSCWIYHITIFSKLSSLGFPHRQKAKHLDFMI